VTTGIYKDPVEGRIMVRRPIWRATSKPTSGHGGWDKAVYVYHPSIMHSGARRWRGPAGGMFGENFTTEG
jgi:MOSC domain-containing protein YiiM